MPSAPDITKLWGNFKNLVKKITYDKTEVDDKLSDKADFDHVHSKLVPTSIPENADLNDYTTQGSFKCGMNVTAATLINCPTNKAFHLEVYAHAGVRQVLYTYMDKDNWAYERNWSGSGGNGNRWDEWRRIPTDLDIASLNSSKANTNHTHSVVTTSANGFMSSADKTKLNGIATGANKTTVDTALSSTSTNPVQNKVIYSSIGDIQSALDKIIGV